MREIFIGFLAVLFASSAAYANDKSLPSGITGDWNGTRTDLANQGWQFEAKGIFEGAYNPSGGNRQSAAGASEVDLATLADLGKLMGDDGGSLEVKFTDRFGANLVNTGGLHTLMQQQEIWGRGDIWRLSRLSFSQDLFDRKVNIELGRINPGEDIDALSCNFENLNFCGSQPGNIEGGYWFNAPISQWGARVKWNVTDAIAVAGGIYQTNPINLMKGFTFDFSGGTGALVPIGVEWKPALWGLPGDYNAGGWFATMHAPDVFYDRNRNALSITGLAPMQDSGRSGLYFSLKQQLTGQAPPKDAAPNTNGKGLTLFFNYAQADRRTSMLDRQFAMGVIYKGAIPGRDNDEIAISFGSTHVNDRVATGEILQDAAGPAFMPVQHSEYVTEFDYRAALVPSVVVTPNVQYIADPGGVSARDDILVLGIKTALAL